MQCEYRIVFLSTRKLCGHTHWHGRPEPALWFLPQGPWPCVEVALWPFFSGSSAACGIRNHPLGLTTWSPGAQEVWTMAGRSHRRALGWEAALGRSSASCLFQAPDKRFLSPTDYTQTLLPFSSIPGTLSSSSCHKGKSINLTVPRPAFGQRALQVLTVLLRSQAQDRERGLGPALLLSMQSGCYPCQAQAREETASASQWVFSSCEQRPGSPCRALSLRPQGPEAGVPGSVCHGHRLGHSSTRVLCLYPSC